jgi:hypothetical protein
VAGRRLGRAAAGLLYGAALDAQARRLPGPVLPLALLLSAAGTAAVLGTGYSLKQTQLAGLVAAALLPVALRAALRPGLTLATPTVLVLLPGLWLIAHFYNDPPPTPTSLALLAAAGLAGGAGWLPLRGVWRGLLGVVAAALLAAAAWWACPAAPPQEPWLLRPREEVAGRL